LALSFGAIWLGGGKKDPRVPAAGQDHVPQRPLNDCVRPNSGEASSSSASPSWGGPAGLRYFRKRLFLPLKLFHYSHAPQLGLSNFSVRTCNWYPVSCVCVILSLPRSYSSRPLISSDRTPWRSLRLPNLQAQASLPTYPAHLEWPRKIPVLPLFPLK
jgi:hypothetical protein